VNLSNPLCPNQDALAFLTEAIFFLFHCESYLFQRHHIFLETHPAFLVVPIIVQWNSSKIDSPIRAATGYFSLILSKYIPAFSFFPCEVQSSSITLIRLAV